MIQFVDYYITWEWCHIFFRLSMDSCDPLWDELKLPVEMSPNLKSIAREFVTQFAQLAIPRDEREKQISQLFQETYNVMVAKLGKEAAQSICIWGNKLSTIQEFNIFSMWREKLFKPLIDGKIPESTLIELGMSPKRLQTLKTILSQTEGEIRAYFDRAWDADDAERSTWDEYVVRLYTKGAMPTFPKDGDPLMSPLDWMPEQVAFLKGQALWELLTKLLTSDELGILATWAQTQAKEFNIPPDKVTLPDLPEN